MWIPYTVIMNKKTRSSVPNTVCVRCNGGFRCGVAAGDGHCWCFDYPRLDPLPHDDKSTEGGCLCPRCLQDTLQTQYTKHIRR